MSVTTFDASHLVVAYRDGGNSNFGTAILGTVSGSTITYGSEYVFNSASTYYCSVTALDATHIVIAYQDNGSSNDGTAIVGTISGSTIAFSSEYVFQSLEADFISISALDATHIVIGYMSYNFDTGNGKGICQVGTVSGNTIAYGSEFVIKFGETYPISVTKMDANDFVVAYSKKNLSNGYARVGHLITGACPEPTDLVATNITINAANLDWTENGSATIWEYDYDVSGYGEPIGSGNSTITKPVSISGLSEGTAYDFYTRADCGGGTYSSWEGPKTFSTPELCPDPSDPITTNVSVSSADLDWTENGTATKWEYDYGVSGYGPPTGAGTLTTSHPFTLSGLSGATTYDWYIRTDCGGGFGYSDWIGPTTFLTLPYNNDTWTGAVSTDWNTAGNWNSGTVPGGSENVSIPSVKAFHPVINTGANCNTLTIDNGASLTIASSGSITATGVITNNGTFSIKSDATGTGSLINSTTGINATVERYATTDKWHTFSPSVSNETAGMFHFSGSTGFDTWLIEHHEITDSYSYITDLNKALNPLQGYNFWGAGTSATPPVSEWTFEMNGLLNTGTFGNSNNLTRTNSAPFDTLGWNFLGNPYPSALDWYSAFQAATTNNIDATVYIYNSPNWAVWNNISGGLNGGSQYIATGQGFFIRVSTVGTGTFIVNNTNRVHNGAPYLKSEISDIVKLQISDGIYTDETAVVFNMESTEGFDNQFDSYKMFSYKDDVPQIYSKATTDLAVNVLPEVQSVPIYIKGEMGKNLNINISENNYFPDLFLEDIITGEITDLNKNTY